MACLMSSSVNASGAGQLMQRGVGLVAVDRLRPAHDRAQAGHGLQAAKVPTGAWFAALDHSDVANLAGAEAIAALVDATVDHDTRR